MFSIKTYVFFLVYYVFVFMFLVSMFSDCFYFTSILFYFYFDFHFFSKSHTGWGALSRTQFSRISYCVKPSVTNPELKKHSFLFLLWLFFFQDLILREVLCHEPSLSITPNFFFQNLILREALCHEPGAQEELIISAATVTRGVCVCVWERERERERESYISYIYIYIL